LYKRLSAAADPDEVQEILDEIGDRYGKIPDPLHILGDLTVVGIYGKRLGAISIDVSKNRISLQLSENTPIHHDKIVKLLSKPKSPYRLTPSMHLIRELPPRPPDGRPSDRAQGARQSLLQLLAYAT